MMKRYQFERGQIIIILLLVIVVALAVGLTIVGTSISEISTTSKIEDSSRAFSAAEAGIESAFQQTSSFDWTIPANPSITPPALSNRSTANVNLEFGKPALGQALEYPPFGREEFAQFWLASPKDLAMVYNNDNLDIYFGDSTQSYANPNDRPAIEIKVVLKSTTGSYYSKSFFYDSHNGRGNNFTPATLAPAVIATSEGLNRSFYAKANVSSYKINSGDTPIMARVRLLYSSTDHPVALQPTSGNLPAQNRTFQSRGQSGNTQRVLTVWQTTTVMPEIFDYVLFSAYSEINK